MIVCRCNSCGKWIGSEEELEDVQRCPVCGKSEGIMDLEAGCSFDDKEIEILWELFGDISTNDMDEIEEEFLGFPAGTDRFEIWHWFDEMYPRGVEGLIGVPVS